MSRSLSLAVFLISFSALPAFAALEMTIQCTPQGNSSTCTATTTNRGTVAASGTLYTGFQADAPAARVTFSGFTNSLGLTQCFDGGQLGAEVPFIFCFDFGQSLAPGASFTSSVVVSSHTTDVTKISIGAFTGIFGEDDETEETAFVFTDINPPTCSTTATIPPLVNSGVQYTLTWTAVSQSGATYEVQESTSADFTANLRTLTTNTTALPFDHTVTANTTYYYRVRALSCGGSAGTFSPTVSTVVQVIPVQTLTTTIDAAVPLGSTNPVRIPVRIEGAGAGATFTATIDKPYLGVDPSSGNLPPGGITIDVVANPRDLPPGASMGTLTVTVTTPNATGGRFQTHGSTTTNTTVSVNLVTPVTPGTKSAPGPDTLIIPVVTHVNGVAGPFLSDVRLTNDSASPTTYQITLTPTRSDITQSKSTKVTVASGQTVALNDIVKNFFGIGATSDPNDAGAGPLDIRAIGSTHNLTFASSRTYARTAAGTFGQFIAAVPMSRFASNAINFVPVPGAPPEEPPTVLSLQQIAQSAKFRTNLGIVEGSGDPANGRIRVLSVTGSLIKEIPYSLKGGEHQQINSFLSANGITNLEDGRLEITVDSPLGAVSGYASVLDQVTSDPLAVMPVDATSVSSTRYVIPGIADLQGTANFHSDVRVFNGGTSPVTMNMTYFPQANPGGARTASPVTIAPGEVKVFDNILPTLFSTTGSGGSVLMTTSAPSSLVVTGRTYSIGANNGTFGQFIPGVTPAEGMGVGDRALQILQLEQSQNFRSNLGLAELSGNAVTLEAMLILPDSKLTPIVTVDLAPNEFRQLNSVIAAMGFTAPVYNARMTVKVVGGTGRVTTYGSVIDNATQDPTYVPAQ